MTDEITLDAPETRLERFLAAAAGMDGITLDEPVTRIEKYLYKIAQGSGGVPAVEDADKGKYLHANESTGDLEWATAGGSGGGDVVVSNITVDVSGDEPVYSCDMTESEITAAIGDGKTVLAVLGGGAAISVWSDFLLVDFNFINSPTSTLQFMRFMYDQGSFIKQREVAYTLTPAT